MMYYTLVPILCGNGGTAIVPRVVRFHRPRYCVRHVIQQMCAFDAFVGGCCGARNRKTIIGGWGWAWWFVTDVQTYVTSCILLHEISLRMKFIDTLEVAVSCLDHIKK